MGANVFSMQTVSRTSKWCHVAEHSAEREHTEALLKVAGGGDGNILNFPRFL